LTVARAEPLFFAQERRPLFGWLHRPDSQVSHGVGLLICSPLGYDSITSHRSLRHLAEAAAARGFPALRFDYDGIGDSAGQDVDPARVDAWVESICVAARELREQAGVAEVVAFGIRLGATLAMLAAQRAPGITGAILVNPVVEGRRYLRELKALAATSAIAPVDADSSGQDIQEAAGFITTAATRESIGAIRLAGDSLNTAPSRVLLVERTDLPADSALAGRLTQLGSVVTRLAFAGYADMLRDTHETVVPRDMIRDALDWIVQRPASVTTTPRLEAHCELDWPSGTRVGRVRERALHFGARRSIFGIVTEEASSRGDQQRPVLLLLNSGAVHHVGPNRLYVRIARSLAQQGFVVVRLDLPGLGDSPVDAGHEENQTYPEWSLTAIREAVDFASNELGASEIHSAGICSGAYHSLKAAVAGMPLRSVVVINPLTFFWQPGMLLAQPAFQDTSEVMRYRRTGLSAASLRKLFTGKVDLRNLAGILTRYAARRAKHAARDIGRCFGIQLRNDLVSELRKVSNQGTRMHFIFSRTDPGHALLREQAGKEMPRLMRAGALTADFIEGSDHTFTPRAAQESLLALLATVIVMPSRKGKRT
jgi:alpha-beta hydrolase superfamily lysophospholipase